MRTTVATLLAGASAAMAVSVTPHQQFSSSIGVVGCKIDTNRVAYWPEEVTCDNICVQVSYQGRSVKLLRIDHSGGAHDISYDAWNYLYTGRSAMDAPAQGGGIEMDWRQLNPWECSELIHTSGNRLPMLAANAMNFVSMCVNNGSWLGKNFALFNIAVQSCRYGIDEECTLNGNLPTCPSGLGNMSPLNEPVWDIEYGTGKRVQAW
jgi:hypothetical protein